jgi:prefoldin subunit 5
MAALAKPNPTQPRDVGGITVVKSENTSGIPQAVFIEDVNAFLSDCSAGAPINDQFIEGILDIMQQEYSKFKMMEQQLTYNLQQYKTKIPEINKTLNAIIRLKDAGEEDKELKLSYSLADNVWAKAHIVPEDKVYLWLGANVMLEYSYDDAMGILNENLAKAKEKEIQTRGDLAFLKDQITTSEVNIARVYNHSVIMKRGGMKSAAGATEKK